MKAIHQLTAGFTKGDAISNEAAVLRELFRSWGHASRIFCEPHRVLPEYRPQTCDAALAGKMIRPDDAAILHLSIGSVVNEIFATLKCRKAIIYHNMTPPDYFRGIQEHVVRELEWGREQARRLAGTAEVVMAVSRFNAGELEKTGYDRVRVLPLLLDFAAIKARPDRAFLRRFADGRTNVLFVGRGAPNKRIEDLLCAFYYFQETVDPRARLIHAGSYTGLERYQALVQALARKLGIREAVFTGSISQAELNACYECAHVFLCMSEHEGFCIPLLESMAHDVPVLAYAAGAVPETLDGAGAMFREKKWPEIAELAGKLAIDAPLRDAVILKQRERLERYRARNLAVELKECLAPLLGA